MEIDGSDDYDEPADGQYSNPQGSPRTQLT